jgi:hypothetical protein
LITNHCPHFEDTPVGELCERCEQEGVGIVELDADGEGIVTFLVPISQGLALQELRDLLSQETQGEALVRRKLMSEEELQEAMVDPYEEDPEAAEEDALEDELAWKLNLLMTDLVGDMWGRATLYVVPEGSESSWTRALLRTSPEEVRAALEGQTEAE